MWTHPNSTGHNFVSQFPEIFNRYEPIRFQLPNGRMRDFIDSSSFLFGSQANRDLNMVFSGVQRVSGGRHLDFQTFMRLKKSREKLLSAKDDTDLSCVLDGMAADYNKKFGMRKQVLDFYSTYADPGDVVVINSEMFAPAPHVLGMPGDPQSQMKIRLDLLLKHRHRLDHAATYTPFSNGVDYMRFPEVKYGQEREWLSLYTFDQFYEMTRKAMANLWIQEYEQYLRNGGQKIVGNLVADLTRSMGAASEKKCNRT